MARNDAISNGVEAERALHDTVYQAAYEATERRLVDAICALVPGSPTYRAQISELVHELRANRKAKLNLIEQMNAGKLEANRTDLAELRHSRAKDPRWG